ncbi:MAG: HAD-IIA family hydrolase [Methanomicrobia archaeon]|nr:HAD-IIA family hydrolase [Methanomicrobia archaeon]
MYKKSLNIKGIIFDIDGVLEFQGKIYDGAIETINSLRDKGIVLRFLTNSTLKSRKSCADKLKKRGFRIFEEEIITASYATALYLKKLNPKSCWVMLEREGLNEFRDFTQNMEKPEYVVVGDNRSNFDFNHLNKALRLLLKGVKLIAMTPGLVDASMGQLELDVGSWAQMLERASGVKAVYVGKPNPYVFELALKSMNLDRSEVVMVGDQISTDIKGANNVGMRSILLKTGEFDERDLNSNIKPDFIFDSIRDILKFLIPKII